MHKHIINTFIAGFVALLPIGGLIISIAYMETTISSTGISKLPFYFPGLGLLLAATLIYSMGLLVTTFVGKWLWGRVDGFLDHLPALGRIYQTIKQILGYGKSKDAIFLEAVLISGRDHQSQELGLVTNKITEEDGSIKLIVFVPGSPSPTSGRLLIIDNDSVKRLAVPVSDVLKSLVSVGKTEISLSDVNGDNIKTNTI